MLINQDQVKKGEICPYCGQKTQFVDSSIIYNGKSYGMIYYCEPCYSWVGVHKGTNKALGRLANHQLREAKKKAHAAFDPIWKEGLINRIWNEYLPKKSNRAKAYIWLSKQLGIESKDCHIGHFNVLMCNQVISICEKAKHEKSID